MSVEPWSDVFDAMHRVAHVLGFQVALRRGCLPCWRALPRRHASYGPNTWPKWSAR